MRALFVAAAIAAAVGLSGCGGEVPRGTVRGTLKLQGQPLTGAPVVFLASDNRTHVANVNEDGTYTVTGVAYGRVRVSVQSAAERAAVKGSSTPRRARRRASRTRRRARSRRRPRG
jgi:hypothetical protein